jgi:hypothetical protein
MAFTQVQIISNAITLLGKGMIVSLIGQSPLVDAAVQAYTLLVPSIISENFWRFTTTIVQLSQLNIVPVIPRWTTVYELPGDYLKTINVFPQQYDWEIYQNSQLYSNFLGPFFMEYERQPDPTLFPPYFVRYLCYEIAYYLYQANAQITALVPITEKERNYRLAVALAADSQNRPQTPLISAPMIKNRFVATWVCG